MRSVTNYGPPLSPALLLLLCGACSQVPATQRHVFDAFEITVPASWTVRVWQQDTVLGDPTPTGGPMVSDVRFEGADGEYLSIHDERFDLTGPWDGDCYWQVKADSNGRLEITTEGGLCSKSHAARGVPNCLAGDGRLDALAHLDFKYGFEIKFGNTKRERGEDLRPFSAILRTFRAF